MTNKIKTFNARSWCSIVGVLTLICAASVAVIGQTPSTAGSPTISSTATSSYSDGTDSYATKSITVSVTAGLTSTPDAGTNPTVVLDPTLVDFKFKVSAVAVQRRALTAQ